MLKKNFKNMESSWTAFFEKSFYVWRRHHAIAAEIFLNFLVRYKTYRDF